MKNKPKSPHITVYSIGIVPMMSMAHRLSGVFLILIVPIISITLSAAVFFPDVFKYLTSTWIIYILFAVFVFNVVLHIVLGLRHMIWDFGLGFSKSYIKHSGYFSLYFSILITIIWFYYFVLLNG